MIIRTLRLWWARELHGMPADDPVDLKNYASSYYAAPSVKRAQDPELGDTLGPLPTQTNYEALICQAADEIRSISIKSSQPTLDTTNATLNPHVMSASATARSQPAPS